MTSTLSAFAPTGFLGTGSVDARPYACTAVRPELPGVFVGVTAVEQGSGLPTAARPLAGMAPRFRGWAAGATGATGGHLPIDATTTNDEITKNDGTTLGIHSPGRPLS